MKRLVSLLGMAFVFIFLITMVTPAFTASTSTYTGGFFDDGLYDDDWYFDYYDLPTDSQRVNNQDSSHQNHGKLREYEASQMYEEAEESGIFNF